MIELILIISLFCVIVIGLLYCFGFRKHCYRVVEKTYMQYNGKLGTNFVVEQYNKLFIFNWWLMADSGDEYSSGSVFDSIDEANAYIKSVIYNIKKHELVHEPICADSIDKE